MFTKITAGKIGENFALDLLKRHGYKILTRNFRSRFGEIDIIAEDRGVLVFIEVKTRWSKKFGNPEEAVTHRKIRHLIRTAEYFKLLNPNTPDLMRVDVVATEVKNGKINGEIIKNVTG